jgi:hypothetical protein
MSYTYCERNPTDYRCQLLPGSKTYCAAFPRDLDCIARKETMNYIDYTAGIETALLPATIADAAGTKYVLTTTHTCTQTTNEPDGTTLQELIDNCTAATMLGGISQCVGLRFSPAEDGSGNKRVMGCLATGVVNMDAESTTGVTTYILESEELKV